ncbi:MAG: hypothetical protein M3Y06_07790 [Actinomycetota bacterium]|nr:hypothetical protein [Actinomycetota bacterium]
MRLRMLGAAVVVVLAAGTLTACRTNVGFAASVDGHSYSESDIADYVTPQAQPVQEQVSQTQTLAIPPRSYVVQTIIESRLEKLVLDALPGRGPTAGELATIQRSILKGVSPMRFAESSGLHGYSPSFAPVYVRARTYSALLGGVSQNAQRQGVQLDLAGIARRVHMKIEVNPRYGRWDAQNLYFDSSAGATVPAFLKLKSNASATTDTQQPVR